MCIPSRAETISRLINQPMHKIWIGNYFVNWFHLDNSLSIFECSFYKIRHFRTEAWPIKSMMTLSVRCSPSSLSPTSHQLLFLATYRISKKQMKQLAHLSSCFSTVCMKPHSVWMLEKARNRHDHLMFLNNCEFVLEGTHNAKWNPASYLNSKAKTTLTTCNHIPVQLSIENYMHCKHCFTTSVTLCWCQR